jgi:hypothetical protein
MPNYNIERLKHEQEEVDRRKVELAESYAPFRKAFFGRLRKFTKEAVEIGLRNVKECRVVDEEDEFYEAECMLNGIDLDIVASSHVIPLDIYSEILASQIMIFTGVNENAEPYAKVVYYEAPGGAYRYEVLLLVESGIVRLKIRGDGNADGGREAAEVMLQHFYSLRRHWTERPSLRAIREGRGAARTMGFLQQKK